MSFVGTKTVTKSELNSILKQINSASCWYFLRWVDRVSGFINGIPIEISIEGQIFNSDWELRWQATQENFSLLLLSQTNNLFDFQPLGNDWETQIRQAYLYPTTETRFPKGINSSQVNINQCYFRDRQTATIHFIALTTRQL